MAQKVVGYVKLQIPAAKATMAYGILEKHNTAADMENLKYVQLPASVKTIAENAFAGCNIFEAVAPAGSVAEEYCRTHGIPVTNS